MYLNEMPFGSGNLGVQAASKFYFGHPVQDDTVAESAMLVIQLASPSLNNPIRNPQRARRLQREILDQMVQLRYVTKKEADDSFDEYWARYDYTRRELQRLPGPRGQGPVLQRVHPRPARRSARRLLRLPDRRPRRAHDAQPRLPAGGGRAHGPGHRQGERPVPRHGQAPQVSSSNAVLPAAHRHARVHVRHRRPDVPEPQRRRATPSATTRARSRRSSSVVVEPLRPAEGAGHHLRRASTAPWR